MTTELPECLGGNVYCGGKLIGRLNSITIAADSLGAAAGDAAWMIQDFQSSLVGTLTMDPRRLKRLMRRLQPTALLMRPARGWRRHTRRNSVRT